jgi:hypothetical protein
MGRGVGGGGVQRCSARMPIVLHIRLLLTLHTSATDELGGHLDRPTQLVSRVHRPVLLMPSHVPPLVTGNWNWRPRPLFVSTTAPLPPVLNPDCTGPATLLSSFFHRSTVLPMMSVPRAAAVTTMTMMKMTMNTVHRCPTTKTMTKMTTVHRCPMRMMMTVTLDIRPSTTTSVAHHFEQGLGCRLAVARHLHIARPYDGRSTHRITRASLIMSSRLCYR